MYDHTGHGWANPANQAARDRIAARERRSNSAAFVRAVGYGLAVGFLLIVIGVAA